MKKLILVGAGGHAKSCLEVIELTKKFKILGFVDNSKKGLFEKFKILGNDDYLKKIKNKSKIYIIITIGQIKNYKKRSNLFKKLQKFGFKIPVIISKSASVSKFSKIGNGTMVFNSVIINRSVEIGKNCIINSGALLEHDVKIGSNTHISTRAIINGNVKVGSNTFIGSGTIIKQGVSIGKNCIVGMGSIVKKNLKNYSIIYK